MKRNYPLIRCDDSIYNSEYYKNQDYQDNYIRGEKIVHPPYVDEEEDVYNRCIINYFLTALELLKSGRDLSELIEQDFRNLIEEWFLRKDGWTISKNSDQENNHRFLITKKLIDTIGDVNCVWLTKKYSLKNKVGIDVVRELEYLIGKANVSKGCIVTTSRLTQPAIKMIKENSFRMAYIDNEMLKSELVVYGIKQKSV